ncbi:hypothetical protein BO94DRAFT_532121 [Aspergillus sclerotioniger CBS 115572]|uniref:RING finger domain protein n=1 Tax=Aspergillus sclerotioniger CBS 115572 TaxID=1450535 RepID=A0A317XC97_9EURO|nr:hypothetical protein BO94DRAFT_532121 [Aspergillus sclerotioniger CBS 115572]PWY94160.1 hypothetical protein BO94DRAFT_532121 [Aspergillus sclerotioniger CBS 115572]
MSDDSGVLFVGSRPRKRTHREMSETSSERAFAGPSSSSRTPGSSLPPLRRYPGDGLDFRRPVTSASPQIDEVIDLTNEPDTPEQTARHQPPFPAEISRRPRPRPRPRPPRFPRDILTEVVDLEEEPDNGNHQDHPDSPEVQFVGATVLRPQLPPLERQPPLLPYNRMPTPMWRDVVLPPTPPRQPGRFDYRPFTLMRIRDDFPRLSEMESFWIGNGRAGAVDLTINLDVDGPLGLDYQLTGVSPERAPGNSYKPPSPPPEGFTRNIEEDDVVICPNCEMELGMGDEVKQQIWVVKQCGHVYCGECASNRSLSKAKKTTSKTKAFSKCQVIGCHKPVSSPRSMFQIYL